MNQTEREPILRRILVALDASPHSLAALEAAAELAGGLGAELAGLFVEDVNLVRMAQLPRMRTVGSFSASLHELDSQRLEWALRAEADHARKAIEMAAEKARVGWSFHVARGAVASEVLAAASESDLISLGKLGWSPTGVRRLGSTARAIASAASVPALILEQGARLEPPVLVVYDGSRTSQKALGLAAQLARVKDEHLSVYILSNKPDAAQLLKTQAQDWLEKRGFEARFHRLNEADAMTLVHEVRTQRGGVLMLPGGSPLLKSETLIELINEAKCPVLLVQ